MPVRPLSLISLTALLVAATQAFAAPAAELDPASPKGAMKAFYEAMEASDAAAVRASFHAANDEEKQLADAYAALLTSFKSLGDVAKAKYGASGDALSRGMPAKDEIARLAAAEVAVTGDTATITLAPKGKPFKLVKSDGRWRLSVSDYAGASPENIANQVAVLKDMAATFTAVSGDIAADKFATAADAQRVLQQKLQAVVYKSTKKPSPATARTKGK